MGKMKERIVVIKRVYSCTVPHKHQLRAQVVSKLVVRFRKSLALMQLTEYANQLF